MNSDAGAVGYGCNNDSQCADGGANGRCEPSGSNAGPSCSYDTCVNDVDCSSGQLCVCGSPLPPYGRTANGCEQGNCRLDTDCGPGGFCSPSVPPRCGDGQLGYYCHTPSDDCVNDSDCHNDGGFGGGSGICTWQPTVSKWACTFVMCAG